MGDDADISDYPDEGQVAEKKAELMVFIRVTSSSAVKVLYIQMFK